MYQELVQKVRESVIAYQKQGNKLFVSSSFQTHSIPLLHIVSNIDRSIPIYFLETGFHFPETHIYRDQIRDLLGLRIINLESYVSKVNQKDNSGKFYFCSNSDYCCHLNKILPLEPVLQMFDVWITGVRKDQNSNRSKLKYEAQGPFNTVRFHPMLEWNTKMIWEYRKDFDLPPHPLEEQGYLNIGCQPCTEKHIDGDRLARWAGQKKDECGLHTELIQK
jgi:phosphoadenosine phosphosulfate reductase